VHSMCVCNCVCVCGCARVYNTVRLSRVSITVDQILSGEMGVVISRLVHSMCVCNCVCLWMCACL